MKYVLFIILSLPIFAMAEEQTPFYLGDKVTVVNYGFYKNCSGIVTGRHETRRFTDEPSKIMYHVQLSCKDRKGNHTIIVNDLNFYEKDLKLK